MVAIAIACLVIAAITANNNRRAHRYYMVQQIGHDLIAQTNSILLAQLDAGFRAKLTELFRSETSVAYAQIGDESRSVGNGNAHAMLILTNTSSQRLIIRLRIDSHSNRFRILSYRTQ